MMVWCIWKLFKSSTFFLGIHDGTPFEGTRKYSLRDLLEGEDCKISTTGDI